MGTDDAKVRIIIDNTNFLASKIKQKWISLTYLYLIMLNRALTQLAAYMRVTL